jgi:hypothetical protein
MTLRRRTFLGLAAGAAALPAAARLARAQGYPSRPVRIIVGFPPGGATDIQARLMGQWLSERLGQQFIVENRAGASGNIGTEAVAKAPPDGYTLLQIVTPHPINAALYTNLSFDFIRDIAPVTCVARLAYVVVVHPSVPAATLPEGLRARDAAAVVAEAARTHGAVFVNVAHHVPRHRACTLSLLRTLYGQGYRYFAVEAVNERYTALNTRGHPVFRSPCVHLIGRLDAAQPGPPRRMPDADREPDRPPAGSPADHAGQPEGRGSELDLGLRWPL